MGTRARQIDAIKLNGRRDGRPEIPLVFTDIGDGRAAAGGVATWVSVRPRPTPRASVELAVRF